MTCPRCHGTGCPTCEGSIHKRDGSAKSTLGLSRRLMAHWDADTDEEESLKAGAELFRRMLARKTVH